MTRIDGTMTAPDTLTIGGGHRRRVNVSMCRCAFTLARKDAEDLASAIEEDDLGWEACTTLKGGLAYVDHDGRRALRYLDRFYFDIPEGSEWQVAEALHDAARVEWRRKV